MAATAAVAGLAIVVILDAPQPLIALIVALLAGLALTTAITRYWKISLHTGVAAGSATILTIVFGPVLLSTGVFVAAIGWSRIHLRDHTPSQAIIGGLLGAAVAATAFSALR